MKHAFQITLPFLLEYLYWYTFLMIQLIFFLFYLYFFALLHRFLFSFDDGMLLCRKYWTTLLRKMLVTRARTQIYLVMWYRITVSESALIKMLSYVDTVGKQESYPLSLNQWRPEDSNCSYRATFGTRKSLQAVQHNTYYFEQSL